ncbi:MAG: 3-hydroxyacyl-ACP dehydratase [Bacteroidetes bacterium 4572_77]|nr:MAG: 3-hydroxyacyl-ACP dehydratase [Bacteroidetes bacterium 4572_77]
MLENKLYIIKEFNFEKEELKAQIEINPQSEIFKGHFPDVPVLPGVSMMHLVKELLEKALNRSLNVVSAKNIKFLQMVNPTITNTLDVLVNILDNQQDELSIKASLQSQDNTHFKMTAQLKIT